MTGMTDLVPVSFARINHALIVDSALRIIDRGYNYIAKGQALGLDRVSRGYIDNDHVEGLEDQTYRKRQRS